jgi:predicted amidohydrolase
MPEVTPALAFRGAELISMPAGLDKRRLWKTWRTRLRARAIENLAIVVSTQNLINHANRGRAVITSPQAILYESQGRRNGRGRGRPRKLRAGRERGGSSEGCGAEEGVLSAQWQRPELYDSFYPKPRQNAAE